MSGSSLPTPWIKFPSEIPTGVHGFAVRRYGKDGHPELLLVDELLTEAQADQACSILNTGTAPELLISLHNECFVRADTVTLIQPKRSYVNDADKKRHPASVLVVAGGKTRSLKCRSYDEARKLAIDLREQVNNSVRLWSLHESRKQSGA